MISFEDDMIYRQKSLKIPQKNTVRTSKFSQVAGYKVFPDGTVVKNLPANAGDARDMGSIPGSGRSLGGGNGNPLHILA